MVPCQEGDHDSKGRKFTCLYRHIYGIHCRKQVELFVRFFKTIILTSFLWI